jgi:uncharacterized protein (DUF427 family)/CRP-like cAMP-binding protein
MKAIWNGETIAESNDTIVIEGNHYFPADSLRKEYFKSSSTTTVCPWKGEASYYTLEVEDKENKDAAWYYPEPSELAREIKNRVAFWRGVEVVRGSLNLNEVLSIDEWRKIAGRAAIQHVHKKQILYLPTEPSDNLYILKEGKVKISRFSPDGKELILSIISPGGLFGEFAITGQHQREEMAQVLEDAAIYIIHPEDMWDLMQTNPSLNFNILKQLGNRVEKLQSRLEVMTFKSTEQRILALIKEIAQEHGHIIAGDPHQREIRLALTQADIAKLSATSRQSVSTFLKYLEKQGLIKYDRRRIYIQDLSLL